MISCYLYNEVVKQLTAQFLLFSFYDVSHGYVLGIMLVPNILNGIRLHFGINTMVSKRKGRLAGRWAGVQLVDFLPSKHTSLSSIPSMHKLVLWFTPVILALER